MPVIPENIINLSTNTVPETVIEIDIDDVGRVFVIEAKAQADRAQGYAETSAGYVSRAEIAAGRAEASETSATASATSASASATSATASATTASTDADRAETAATSATSDADRAEAARDAAEDLIPGEGLVGDFLQKTVDGAQWATIPGGGAIWGGITGTLDNQSDLRDRLDTKITAPATGSTGQLLSKTASGTEWVDAPNSAVWGLIQGNLSDQTDVYNAINAKGSVNTVNGIQPNAQKNVQVDVELTQAQYDALPATKLTNNVNYFIKDGAYRPQGSVIDAEGVMYDNTESGLTSDTVQGAIDENASAIEELSAGLIVQFPSTGWTTTETVNGTTYYTQTVSVTSVSGKPIVGITPISGTLPTGAEQSAFDSVSYFTANDTANTIKGYATSAPANNFAVVVKGAR